MKRGFFRFGLFFLILTFSSCDVQNQNLWSKQIPTITHTSTNTPKPSIAPSSTSTITFTYTLTNTPSPTRTFSPTPLQTSTSTNAPKLNSTQYPNAVCGYYKPYVATWKTEYKNMHFDGFLCPDGEFIAILHDQEIPEYMTVNLRGFSNLEYFWGVEIDVDGNSSTGMPETYHYVNNREDFDLVLARWANGKTETDLFENLLKKRKFQINVWEKGKSSSRGKAFLYPKDNKLVLLGRIPGMSENSRILFIKFYRTADNPKNYKTGWIESSKTK